MLSKSATMSLYQARELFNAGDFEASALRAICALAKMETVERAPKESSGFDLTDALARVKRDSPVQGFVCHYSDGSQTRQRVAYAKHEQRWAAAFQACERLRRIRAANRIVGAPRAGSLYFTPGPCGILTRNAYWHEEAATVPLAPLVSIVCEDDGSRYDVEPLRLAA